MYYVKLSKLQKGGKFKVQNIFFLTVCQKNSNHKFVPCRWGWSIDQSIPIMYFTSKYENGEKQNSIMLGDP